MLNNIIGASLTLESALIIFISALVLGLIISYIHMKSSKCSKNMAITLSADILALSFAKDTNGNNNNKNAINRFIIAKPLHSDLLVP